MAIRTGGERPRAFDPTQIGKAGTSDRTPGWDLATERRIDDGRTLSRLMGLFSVGLGSVQMFAPQLLTRFLGIEGNEGLMRAFGAREMSKGVGLLAGWRREKVMWERIAGDVLDLGALAMALPDNDKRSRVFLAMGAVVGAGIVDGLAVQQIRDRKEHRFRPA